MPVVTERGGAEFKPRFSGDMVIRAPQPGKIARSNLMAPSAFAHPPVELPDPLITELGKHSVRNKAGVLRVQRGTNLRRSAISFPTTPNGEVATNHWAAMTVVAADLSKDRGLTVYADSLWVGGGCEGLGMVFAGNSMGGRPPYP